MLSGEHLLAVLWKRRLTLVVTFVAALAAATAVTFSLPKAYTTISYVWVSASQTPESDFEATQLSQVLARTYAELLQTRNLAEAVASEVSFSTSADKLQGAVEVSAPNQSQLLAIEAEAESPERAREIANTYATVFIERSRTLGARGATNSRVTIAEAAPLVTDPSKPRPLLYLLVGAVVAGCAGIGAALLRNVLDQRIHVDSGTTEVLGLPVLARIPRRAHSARSALAREERVSPAERSGDEAFRVLVANLSFVTLGRRPGTLAVVSANEREGKSTCCANVARAAAGIGRSVLIVDGDLRKPSLTAEFCGEPPPPTGLSSLLVGVGHVDDVSVDVSGPAIQLVPAGPIPPNPTALLSSDSLARFERTARERFDLVIYDTPPLSVGADASLVAGRAEGTILVIDTAATRRSSIVQAIAQLERAQATVLGVVLNRVRDASRSSYYYSGDEPGGRGGRRKRRKAERDGDSADRPLVPSTE